MIKINDRFSIEKDKYCWVLHESKPSTKTKGKFSITTTYHADLPQISEAIINKSSDQCESIEELQDLYKNAVEELTDNIKERVKPARRRRRN